MVVRALVFLLVLTAGAAALLWSFAPHLPVLFREGFPDEIVPARGDFAQVAASGSERSLPRAEGVIPPAALELFEGAGGRALVVLRDGQIIAEHYGPETGPDTRLNSYSMVKSLVGVLVLRAVSDGQIAGLDTRLPEILGPGVPDITLADCLTMTSGLHLAGEPPKDDMTVPLDDRDFSPFSPVARLHAFGIEALLPRLGLDPEAAGAFHYQSANTALLGLVLETVHGAPLEEILSRDLWAPSGADPAQWRRNPSTGRVSAYCCLYATPRDWAQVAAYLLSNGTEAASLLPEPLWRAWIQPDLPVEARRRGVYGWHLRHDVLDREGAALQGPFAYMIGHGGQVTYLMPQSGIAVVRFGETPQLLHSTLYSLFPDG